jgi:2-oxoglutarate dehydrogenase complex dehydrogenase (E1) component-like enzyme
MSARELTAEKKLKEALVKGHKGRSKTFKQESYSEQAKTINAEMQNLEKAIKANIRRAKEDGRKCPKDMRIKNLQDLIKRLENYNPKGIS